MGWQIRHQVMSVDDDGLEKMNGIFWMHLVVLTGGFGFIYTCLLKITIFQDFLIKTIKATDYVNNSTNLFIVYQRYGA